jgi:V/A-type H+/Na+-transporting ATPase subunit K
MVMSDLILTLCWAGTYAVMALGAIGSIIGCSIGGNAAIGAMVDSESGHGRFVGVSIMPSSQVIYAIVVMFTLQENMTANNALSLAAIGILAGIALLYSAIKQGQVCASAIHASKMKPEIFGMALAPAAIVEGFAVFTFVFALVAAGSIPS